MLRTSWFLLVSCVLLCSTAERAQAGLFVSGSQFTVDITNDPLGNNFTGNVTLNGGLTAIIDSGLMTLSLTITPVNATTAWIEFDFAATGANPLVGNPVGNWKIQQSNIQTTAPTALIEFFTTFIIDGVSTPFPFSGTTTTTNPLTGVGTVALSGSAKHF